MATVAEQITALWEHRDDLTSVMSELEATNVVRQTIDHLDHGEVRVAEVVNGEVVVHEWVKQAILLLFRLQKMVVQEAGPFEFVDKIPLKTGYLAQRVRVVPGASARWGSYLAPGVTLMPSYVNIGAYVDVDSMVDTWATVGSCAQIGARVHLSGGVGIGGVLEPPQAAPVIIEGARVRRGAKLGAGVILTSSTPVVDVATGEELSRGDVPERAVAVSGTRVKSFPGGDFGMPCVLVLRTLAEGEEHDKLKLNEILREHGVAT
jgi:2,3,4,5-tetrahydropyridine-2-carboxylate N-succinyltransferase